MLPPEEFWPRRLSFQEFDACLWPVTSGLAHVAILGSSPAALTHQH